MRQLTAGIFVGFLGVIFSVLGHAGETEADRISADPAVTFQDPKDFGSLIPRTMALLESASAEHKTKVRILFYGQSIIAMGHPSAVVGRYLQQKYPNAKIVVMNRAIGGYTAPALLRTSYYDLYPLYPDLVIFHVYGGERSGEFEQIISNIRKFTTAEIMTWTHHVDRFNSKDRDRASAYRRDIAQKYGCELVEVRELWKKYLRENKVDPKSLLLDWIHPNKEGGKLLGGFLVKHFQPQPQIKEREGWIRTIALNEENPSVSYDKNAWKKTPSGLVASKAGAALRVEFEGNRVDAVCLPTGKEQHCKILLDGKSPLTCPDTYAVTRPPFSPKAWWPVIRKFEWGKNAVAEKWTLKFRDISTDGKTYKFDLTGSVTGPDGSGDESKDFVSNSGRISFLKKDVTLPATKKVMKKDLPSEFTASWKTYCMSTDVLDIPAKAKKGEVTQKKLVQFWESGKHVLEIIPQEEGVALKSVIVHQPPLK